MSPVARLAVVAVACATIGQTNGTGANEGFPGPVGSGMFGDFFNALHGQSSPSSVRVTAIVPSDMSSQEADALLHELLDVSSRVFAADENEFLSQLFPQVEPFNLLSSQSTGGHKNKLHGKRRLPNGPLSCVCAKDVSKHCSAEKQEEVLAEKEGGAAAFSGAGLADLTKCLLDHVDDIAPRCFAALENQQVAQRCGSEMRELCSDSRPGEGRIHSCLLEHREKLGASCKTYFVERAKERKQVLDRMERQSYVPEDKVHHERIQAGLKHGLNLSHGFHAVSKQPRHVLAFIFLGVSLVVALGGYVLFRWRKSQEEASEKQDSLPGPEQEMEALGYAAL